MADSDLSRPYIGYRSAGRRPESQQDRRAAADAPLSALRGYVAGTLGLPGDIEGLLRMITPGASNETYLPGSEYFQGVLPLKGLQDSPTGRAFQEAGGVTGGAGLGTGARVAGRGAQALGRMTAEQVARGVEGGSPLFSAAAPAYVVKPKGGNWLAGQSERITHQLRRQEPYGGALPERIQEFRYTPEQAELIYAGAAPERAYNTWIDKKLGNYVRNEMATPEDPLRAMAEKWSTEKPQRLAEADAKLDALNAKTRELAAQRGVPEEWLTRHRQDVLKAEKARDLIEAREALHAPMRERGWEPDDLAGKRLQQGFPKEGMGQSEAAKVWEQAADEAIGVGPAGKRFQATPSGTVWGGQTLADNPWLTKVPPETPTYTGYGLNELGFEHLGDELRNALNPTSGLPAELLLKYEDLSKKTVPDIVNRVADINAWRAAQKSETDLAKANNAAVVTYKEYPEQGLAWKQIKMPSEDSVPDETLVRLMQERDMTPDEIAGAMADPEMKRDIARAALEDGDTGILADALKYEGDTMRHCVGGYCPDVSSGKRQIFSLRDERGRPHVTIEVKPGMTIDRSPDELASWLETPEGARIVDKHPEAIEDFMIGDDTRLRQVAPEMFNLPPQIAQIKGLDNGPPEAKYLPAVQDFVRSGQWSQVGDLKHSGLVDISAHPKRVEALGSRYVPEAELNTYLESFPDKAEGFAEGGAVNAGNEPLAYDQTKISSIVAQLHEELNNGY